MGKKNKGHCWRTICIIFIMLLLGGCSAYKMDVQKYDASKLEKIKPDIIKGSGLTLTVQYGFEKSIKQGRHLAFVAEIENKKEEAFEGMLRIYHPTTGNGGKDSQFVYEREVSAGAGETIKTELVMPYVGSNRVLLALEDTDGNTALEKVLLIYQDEGMGSLCIGILSSKGKDYFEYLSGDDSRIFMLETDMLPEDDNGLDGLDVILLHEYDMALLDEGHRDAIARFVKDGGGLFIGTIKDAYPWKELKKSCGKGSVTFLSQELELSYEEWQDAGQEIKETIKENLSETKKIQLELESEGNSFYYSFLNSLEARAEENTPTASKYALILVLYVLFIGPPLYFFLRRYDKLQYAWGIVPVLAVFFTLIIYGMGSATRMTEPYAGYLTISTVGEQKTENKTYFSIVAPYKEKYSYEFPMESGLDLLSNGYFYNYYSEETVKNNKEYNSYISRKEDDTEIGILNNAAFTPIYFQMEQETAEGGTIESRLSFSDYKVEGSITNHLPYDLTDVCLGIGDLYFSLGDLKQGETKSVDTIEAVPIIAANGLYDGIEFISQLTGANPYRGKRNVELLGRYSAYEYYLSRRLLTAERFSCVLTGFKESSNLLLTGAGIENSGTNLVETAVEIDYQKDGKEYVPNLDGYLTLEAEESGIHSQRYMNTATLKGELQFGEEDKITSLIYPEAVNVEFQNTKTHSGFYGSIQAYNCETDNYDTIFTSGEAGELTAVEPYLDEENCIKLLYIGDSSKAGEKEITLPVLGAVKEVD